MKRREFIGLGVALSVGGIALSKSRIAFAAGITEKDILKEGQPAAIANYCETPEKTAAKVCPTWKDKPGSCKTCMFYNTDKSETTFKGVKYARCQLLADPKKAQYVAEGAYCATFVKKA